MTTPNMVLSQTKRRQGRRASEPRRVAMWSVSSLLADADPPRTVMLASPKSGYGQCWPMPSRPCFVLERASRHHDGHLDLRALASIEANRCLHHRTGTQNIATRSLTFRCSAALGRAATGRTFRSDERNLIHRDFCPDSDLGFRAHSGPWSHMPSRARAV